MGLVVVENIGGFPAVVVVAGGWPLGLVVVVGAGGFATVVVDAGWLAIGVGCCR